MNSRLTSTFTFGAIAAGIALAGVVLKAGDAWYVLPEANERVLYLRSGGAAERLMLSFDSLAADVYWLRAIQHYGRDRRSGRPNGRFELLYPLLDLTTTLDPYLSITYRFGAVFLSQPAPTGPGRVDQAVALLEKGLRWSPNQWKYASDIGFIYYWYGTGRTGAAADCLAAAQSFERAAGMPDAPPWLRPLAAVTRARGGDRTGAGRLLQELESSEEEWIRRAARRGLDQLRALDDIDALQALADKYSANHHADPTSWPDLIPTARRDDAPLDPSGVPYQYDVSTHRVTLSPRSPLSPLPSGLSCK